MEELTYVETSIFSRSAYFYGYQGQEKDDEIKGAGNSVNYTFRMHDSRIGRFFAVDPLAAKYPHNSVYAFSENRVVDAIELEGGEILFCRRSLDRNEAIFKVVDFDDLEKGSQFHAIVVMLKDMGLVDESTKIIFDAKQMRTVYGAKNHTVVVSYTIAFYFGTELITFDYDMPVGEIHVEGSAIEDYIFGMIGTGLYSRMFGAITAKKFANEAVKQMFKHFYGTTRGKLLEKFVAQTKYEGWIWLEKVGSNFPTFDFVKGNTYSSFKTFNSQTFNLKQYKGFVDDIAKAVEDGIDYKGVKYKLENGILDILVPKEMLNDFVKPGGKFYEQYQQLIKYAESKNVVVQISSEI